MRPTHLNIDVSALTHNIAIAKQYADNKHLLAMVKGNAYGHGVELVCPHIAPLVDGFGVGFIEEALTVNALGLSKPIVIVEGFFSKDELLLCAEHDFQVCIHHNEQLEKLLESKLSKPLTVWLKYDSGMHRLGFSEDGCLGALKKLQSSENVSEIILMSHLACADDKANVNTAVQIEKFQELTSSFNGKKSLANSAATLTCADAHFDIIRPGIMLYGGVPIKGIAAKEFNLRPAMQLISSVMAIREVSHGEGVGYGAHWKASGSRKIATICCGYGDGYPRMLHPDAHVLIQGKKCPLAGQVSMEMITADVTALDDIDIGEQVILWGEGLPCHEVARWAGTIDYELMTRASLRITPKLFEK